MSDVINSKDLPVHPIRKNTFLGLMISGMGYLYPVIVFVYIARILHPEGLGYTSYASSLTAFFVLFTGLGMPLYGLRAVAEKRKSAGGLLSRELSELSAELMIIRILSGIAAWCVFAVFSQATGGAGSDHALIGIYGFSILFAIPDISWLFKGMEDYISLARFSLLAKLLGIAALFLLVHETEDILKYAWISVLVPLAESVLEIIYAEKKWKLRLCRDCAGIIIGRKMTETYRKHLRPLFFFLMMHCAVTVYLHTDTVMLGLMKDERIVGLYSCAAKIKGILPVLTGTLYTAALPKALELWKEKRTNEFCRLSDRSFHVVYAILLPLAVYFWVFARPWIMLIGGEEYADAVWTMRLLLLAVVPIGLSNVAGGQMLIPMGLEKKLFLAEAVAAVVNILLNAILIPWLSANGAAIATTVSEILVLVYAVRCLRKHVRIQVFWLRELALSLGGCVVAGLAAYGTGKLLSGHLEGIVSLVVYGMVFFTVMLLFRDDLFLEIGGTVKGICRRLRKKPRIKGP